MQNLTPKKILKGFTKVKNGERYITLILRNQRLATLSMLGKIVYDTGSQNNNLSKITRGIQRRNCKAVSAFCLQLYNQIKRIIATTYFQARSTTSRKSLTKKDNPYGKQRT